MEMRNAVEPTSEPWSGPFHVIKRLGEGGYGEVYEAWDPRLKRSIALKRLKPGSRFESDQLLAEGQLAASLRHPAFVQIFSVEGEGTSQAIAMELVPGCTLARLAQDQALSGQRALALIGQVAEAMVQAHAAGLVHGDLKPSNIMVEPCGRIRILDFGLARLIDPLATGTAIIDSVHGTIAYMAPERLQGQAPGPQADIYALGVMLYQLVAGRLPFAQLSGMALIAAHLQSSPARWPLPQVGAGVEALLRAMTATDLAQRYGAMGQVCEAVDALLAPGRALPSPAAAAGARRWRAPAWRTAPLLAVALCAMLAAGSAAVILGARPAAVTAYSEVAAMQSGLQALRRFDREGSLDAATTSFGAVLARRPDHAAANAGISLVYSLRYASDSRDESWLRRADEHARHALRQDSQLALSSAAQAWVLELQGRLEDAMQAADASLTLDPRNFFALNSKAHILLEQGRYAETAAVLRMAMTAYPDHRWFTDLLGTLHVRQNDFVAAEQAFRHSIQIDPESATSYANLNAALLAQNRVDDALQVLQQGLQIRPDSRLYGNLGAAQFARGDYPAAARAFEQAISSGKGNPNFYLDWANLADALRWIPGRQADAARAYDQAITLLTPLQRRDPDNSLLQSRLGLYAAKAGDAPTALRWTRGALAVASAGADIQFRAAQAFELCGDRAAALAALQQSVTLGYPTHLIDTEPDLNAVRRDPRFTSSQRKNYGLSSRRGDTARQF
jgi:serine/threonine-protein kinase